MYRSKVRRKRDRGANDTAQPTKSWNLPCETERVPDPVLSFRSFPVGPTFYLDDYQWENRPRRWVSIGRQSDQAMIIQDPTVSRSHAILGRNQYTDHVYIFDTNSHNGTWVNGLELIDGIEVTSGSLVQLGGVMLLACGRAGRGQRPLVSGLTLHNILQTAIALYGGQDKAAKAWKIAQSTLSEWIKKKKYDVPEALDALSEASDTIPDLRAQTYGFQP